MRLTPHRARIYIALAAFLLVLPSLGLLYKGQEGRFLLARGGITRGPFHESVIYIARHDFSGAVGYIVNKPLDERLKAALPADVRNRLETQAVYFGGPVSFPDQIQTIRHGGNVRQYLGYSGWAPFQLEYELMKGGWVTVDAPREIIFSTGPQTLWRELMKKAIEGARLQEKAIY